MNRLLPSRQRPQLQVLPCVSVPLGPGYFPARGLRVRPRRGKAFEDAGYSRFHRPPGEPEGKLGPARLRRPCACVSRVPFFFFFLNYNTNWWPYYARDCFPRFSFSSGSRSFLSPSSPSITLPQLTLLPASSLPPPQPGYPGLASLLRRPASLRRGLGGSPASSWTQSAAGL